MWILPRPLHTSDFVPDTAALSLDSTESSEICARSLFVRSKPSPARTWSQKWKRDSWTALLSGRILRPSHGQSFVTAWTSSLVATPASPSAQPVNDSAQKTLGTSGHLSQTEFGFSDPSSASLKMSKDTSASDSAKLSESWEQSVIRRRGEYSARLKSGRLTSASGCLSWPSPIASEVRQGFQDRSRGMKGSQESLTTVVVRLGLPAQANPSTHGSRQGLWPTITAHTPDMESNGPNGHAGTYLAGAVKAEENWVTPRTSGTSTRPNKTTPRQGLTLIEQARANEWRTPGASDGEGGVMEMREGCAGKYKLRDHVVAVQKQEWRTPTVAEEKNQNTSKQIYLQNQVGAVQKQWETPNAFCFQPPENTEQWTKRAEFQQTEKGVNLHKPIQTQVLHEVEKQWATPRLGGEEKAETRLARGKDIGLHGQVGAMTNSAKLNPRWVETLMGLPVGWTMPSCAYPVTIALTNCASSATESSQQQQNELFECFGRKD